MIVVALLPFTFPSSYYLRVASLVWVSAFAAIGLNVLMGKAGQVSLGHAAFFGIGAYSVAIGPAKFGLPSLASLAIGACVAGLLAYLVGRPILRLKTKRSHTQKHAYRQHDKQLPHSHPPVMGSLTSPENIRAGRAVSRFL